MQRRRSTGTYIYLFFKLIRFLCCENLKFCHSGIVDGSFDGRCAMAEFDSRLEQINKHEVRHFYFKVFFYACLYKMIGNFLKNDSQKLEYTSFSKKTRRSTAYFPQVESEKNTHFFKARPPLLTGKTYNTILDLFKRILKLRENKIGVGELWICC